MSCRSRLRSSDEFVVEQSDLLKLAIDKLRQLEIRYAIVGSFASGIWGEPRQTQDIDIVVDLKSPQVPFICSAFPDPQFYVSRTAAEEAVAQSSQFNVINPSSGNKIDFMVAGHKKWVLAQLDRSKQLAIFPDQLANVAAPEDVILGKFIYYREGGSEKHLRDISGILRLSSPIIDRAYLVETAKQLRVDDLLEALLNSLDRI
jgi:hypothetical protein